MSTIVFVWSKLCQTKETKMSNFFARHMDVAARSQEEGAHPFGCILVGPDDDVLLEQVNCFSTDGGPGHAETNLARAAARKYSPEFLSGCTLYTSVEP